MSTDCNARRIARGCWIGRAAPPRLWFGVEFAVGHVSARLAVRRQHRLLEDAALNFLILVAVGWSARTGPASACCSPACPGSRRDNARHRLAEGRRARRAGCSPAVVDRRRRAGRQPVLRADADALPPSSRQPDAGGVPVGTTTHSRMSRSWRPAWSTAWAPSAWPDLAVGLGIAAMNAGACREVGRAARGEYHDDDRAPCGAHALERAPLGSALAVPKPV